MGPFDFDWSDETDAQSDINERYAGERIPPFWEVRGVDEYTGEPIPEDER